MLQCFHYSNLFSYTQFLLEKSYDKCSMLDNSNYNKIFHIINNFVPKLQVQLLTLSVIKTFLSFAAPAVFHTLSALGGINIHVNVVD